MFEAAAGVPNFKAWIVL